eukprot:gene5155-7175_t
MTELFLFTFLISIVLSLPFLFIQFYAKWIRYNRNRGKKSLNGSSNIVELAFFHPYCDSGGGGERVLWVCIHSLLARQKTVFNIKVYSGELNRSKEDILKNVERKFSISFNEESKQNVTIIPIRTRFLLSAEWYPIATMFCQSIASLVVGLECLLLFVPDILCDTTGAAFIYPIFKILGRCDVMAYVHYPIISKDMLQKVREQRPSYNNDHRIASSVTMSNFKLIYYNFFAILYSYAGSSVDIVIVNSSWTLGHIAHLWKWSIDEQYDMNINSLQQNKNNKITDHPIYNHKKQRLSLIYPPCNTDELIKLPLERKVKSKRYIISIGQFRPEKDHGLQLRSFKLLQEMGERFDDVVLVLIGSTRNIDDEKLVKSLKNQIINLKIKDKSVLFQINQSYDVLKEWMSDGMIGLHTMWMEHFGISVVEMMAAGLIVIAHNSGGPKLDIIQELENNNNNDNINNNQT